MRSTDKFNGGGTSDYDRLRHLDIYINAGMRVVGLDGKTPAETGWPNVPFRALDKIPTGLWKRKEYNFGWVLDNKDLVIDVDRHAGGADGYQSLARLVDDLGIDDLHKLTPSIVKTGGGGTNYYLSKPSGLRIRKTIPNYPGLDFFSKGGQVVAVGAVHPTSGRAYSFAKGKAFGSKELRHLPPAPEPLLELLSDTPLIQNAASLRRAANAGELSRVIAALSHIDPDIEYPEWIRVLLALHSMQDDDIYLPIADDWSSLGGKYEAAGGNSVESKWNTFDGNPMREPRITVGTLFGLAKTAGWDGTAENFGPYIWNRAPIDFPIPTGHHARSGPMPLTDILAIEYKPLRFIVKDLIPDTGLFLLSSNPKVGKTTLCHQMCLALMGEVSFLGHVNPKPESILFLALEDSFRRIKRRTEQILGAADFDMRNPDQCFDRLLIETEWPTFPDGLSKLDDWLSKNQDTELVVIDTLAAFRGMAGTGARNVYLQDYDLIRRIKKVADKHEVSILMLHHNRKAQAGSPGEAIGGSYGLTGAVDGYMVMESRGFADSEFLLSVQGREIPPQELALKREGFVFLSLGDASMYTMSAERREVIEILKNEPKGLGPMDIANRLGRNPGSTRKLLATMQKRGLIKRLRRGVYTIN